jgi:hypothetical protein
MRYINSILYDPVGVEQYAMMNRISLCMKIHGDILFSCPHQDNERSLIMYARNQINQVPRIPWMAGA